MNSSYLSNLMALLLAATLAGCGSSAPSATERGSMASALVKNGVTATLTQQSSWGGGYCANVTLANGGTTQVTGWAVVVTLSNSTLSQVWNGTSTVSGSEVTVSPLAFNAAIAPGASATFGLCASGAGANPTATLTSLDVTGGSIGTTSYTLAVQVSGNGSTSPAAGSSSYPAGTIVQVTATPASGYRFTGWSGAASGTTNPVSITMDGNKTLTASFTSSGTTSYTLTIGAGAGGTTNPAAGTYGYTAGSVVQVTATAASGYAFAGWSGSTVTATNPVSITMNGNKTLTPAFTPTSTGSAVSINAGGAATGSYTADAYYSGGSTYSTTTAIDTSLLTGTVPPQAVFQTERYGEFTYTIPNLTPGSAQTVTLYFQESYWSAAGQRTFNVAINGTTVLSAFDIFSAAGARYRAVARTFSATANASGQVVIQFTKGGGRDNPKVCGITVAGGSGPTTYALTVQKAGSGSGTVTGSGISCGSTCAATYTSGTSVTLTATPASGATFAGWGGACSGTATCVVSMTADRAVTATFTPPSGTYALTVQKAGSGSGTVTGSGISCGSTCTAAYASGTSVTLTASAASGATFAGWGGACSGTSTCAVSMTADRTVTATFTGPSTGYVVAMVQSTKTLATDLTTSDVASLVQDAVSKAGGLDFIHDGQTVVLKPNLLTPYSDGGSKAADLTVNGITTDWRVVKAVADLVRAKNPTGKILVMEGSVVPTTKAFSMLGYTSSNFGSSVNEFIAVEGTSCADRTTTALVQRTAVSGKQYWVNSRYASADVVISLPTMKTHNGAGITGAVKNLGIGMTPVGQYSASTKGSDDCSRGQTASYIDHTTPENLGAFIRDFYSLRPADFVVMDALQGLEHGPLPVWDSSGSFDYTASRKNMRLILAGKNAVAVDTIAAQVMMCDPRKVPHLTKLEADGLGTADASSITVVGKQVSEVAKPFAGKQTAICPGQVPTTSVRPGSACQAGVSYPAPVLTGTPRLLYRPSGSVTSGTYEGPLWLAASSVLQFSDLSFTGTVNPSQLLRATTAGAVTTLVSDAGTNGQAVDASGTVFACSHKVQGIVRVSSTGAISTFVDNIGGKKFNSPNDLVVRSDGTIYFTDPDFQLGSRTSQTGVKGVYRVTAGGVVSLVDGTFTQPNGIALSPDQSVLYVADYGANVVRKFAVASDGSTSGRANFATVSSPDGLGMDCLGNLYVASGSSGTIQVFSPAGTQLGSISVASSLSNMAFGGSDGRTLFITAGKALYALDMNLPGYFD